MKSIVAAFDIETGEETVLFETDRHLEAPNWTPDGAALIVNGGGRLYRLPLAEPALEEIDTGFADSCNNDHGISPDGTMLVISDASVTRESCIYTLPLGGGTPERITQAIPSYWHGWSPDGQTLAYVGRRTGAFQVFTCPAEGGAEIQLTEDFDHCDGPDYTPDGKWIWFNGERAGSVQLWRIRPDGSDLQQMTADERVNWFPHPSPGSTRLEAEPPEGGKVDRSESDGTSCVNAGCSDGRHIVYLAYEAGTKGHPAEKTVQLRLLPSEGGSPRVLTKLFGGQGTLNVPSWAPDGKRFAFVRYG
ncbi:TolB family protein [Roseibium salinum]|uniref:WD40 repeat protein n=1 Tax=Roseibium salinum TaxID=1604349 RepID=A0ABT3R4W1_9HYPH|nr:hypothetical protein [Roseibium sp. DSM 29163]MCX2724341.1 hypothetical protein [Roseibium sp. DSM 29163]